MKLLWLVFFLWSHLLLSKAEELQISRITLVKCDCFLRDENTRVYNYSDNRMPSLYAKRAELLIDMGEKYEIEKVLVWTLSHAFELSASVGFQQRTSDDQSFYCRMESCREKCYRSTYARFIYVVINSMRTTQHIKLSSIKIRGWKPNKNTKNLAFGRPYLPAKCELNAASINHTPRSRHDIAKLKEEPFRVVLDDVYAIRNISLITKAKEKFDLTLIQNNDKRVKLVINITDCQYSAENKPIICQIPKNKSLLLNAVAVEVKASHLSKLEVYGDPIYYPTIKSTKRTFNDTISLTFTEKLCETNPIFCQGFHRVHQCNEIRIFHRNENSTTLISREESVQPRWKSAAEFTLMKEKRTVTLTVPRSYQYIGSYFAECITNDSFQTKVFSSSIRILKKEANNGMDLKLSIEVGEEGDISKPKHILFESVKNNIILLTKKARYFQVKVKFTSLYDDVYLKERYDKYGQSSLRFLKSSIVKVFSNVSDSWNINVYLYEWLFRFDAVQQSIPFTRHAWRANITTRDRLEVIDMTNATAKNQLFVWEWLRTEKSLEFRAYTASNDSYRLSLTEETCGDGVNDQKILTISKDACSSIANCMKMKIGQSAVIKLTNASPKSLYTLLGFDNSNNRIVIRKTSNPFLLREIRQNLKKIKFTYSILSFDYVQKAIKIRIDISGKDVMEFIKCANLTVKISQLGEEEIWELLTTDYILMKVNSVKNAKEIDIFVQMKFEFLQINEMSEKQRLVVQNPFEFGISDFKKRRLEGTRVQFIWSQPSNELTKILTGYSLNVLGIVQACQSVHTNETITVNKQSDSMYKVILSSRIPKQKIMNYTVTIQPMFKEENNGVNFGKLFVDTFETGSQKKGSLSIINDRRNTSQHIMLTAGQLDLPCTFESAQFNITMVEGLQFTPTFKRINESLYEIGGLIPGKLYDIEATVQYKHGSDLPTDRIRFETVDEILVLKNIVKMLAKMESDINQLKQNQQTILKRLHSSNQTSK